MPPIPNLGKTLMRRLDATFASLTGSWRHRMAGLGKVQRPTVRVPRPMAHGPLLQRCEAGLTDGIPVTRLMLFEQAVADQKPDTTIANLDRRNHGHAP